MSTKTDIDKEKIDPERMAILRSLPVAIKETLSGEEAQSFLYNEVMPDSLLEKLKDYLEVTPVAKEMKKYVCDACGYVYDPAEGDPDNGVNPGTAFADLPADWVCPECGVGLEEFSEL